MINEISLIPRKIFLEKFEVIERENSMGQSKQKNP